MSLPEDPLDGNDTAIEEPFSLRDHRQSEPVFGQPIPLDDSCSHKILLSRAPVSSKLAEQGAFGYRTIGPAIVLKTYLPKKSSPASASSSASLRGSPQSGGSDQYNLREPFTCCTDSIYAELGLADLDDFNSVDDEQMTLPQLDQDSLDTTVDQSDTTGVAATPYPNLVHISDVCKPSEVKATGLPQPTQPTEQPKFLSSMGPSLISSELLPEPLHEHPANITVNSQPLISDQSCAPKSIVIEALHAALGIDGDETPETRKNPSAPQSTCPILPEREVSPQSHNQENAESSATLCLASTTNPPAPQPVCDTTADNALNQTDCPSSHTSTTHGLEIGASVPVVSNTSEAPATDLQLGPVSTYVSTPSAESKVVGPVETATSVCKDNPPCELDTQVQLGESTDPPQSNTTAKAASEVQCPPSPTIAAHKDRVVSAPAVTCTPAKFGASVSTLPQGTESAPRENATTESGKDANFMAFSESSYNPTVRAEVMTSIPSARIHRIRSLSGFFKTLSRRQSNKPDVPSSPGSMSIKSSEEEKPSLPLKILPTKKSFNSLKIKARSPFYRSNDEPVPPIPKPLDSGRLLEREKEVVESVSDPSTPFNNLETGPPLTLTEPATNQAISPNGVKPRKSPQQHKMSRAKRGLRSRTQSAAPSTTPAESIDKPFASVVSELGRNPVTRPKTLKKKRSTNLPTSSPGLRDITLSGLIAKLMGRKTQKAGVA